MVQPLAAAGQSQSQPNTNLSTSVLLSILDRNGNDASIHASVDQPIELIIPRDANLIVSSMDLQNVTSNSIVPHNQLFNLHFVNITQSQSINTFTVSLHFEMHPLNTSLVYLLIYRFDGAPQLNSSIKQIDGWSLLCPSSECFFLFQNQMFECVRTQI
jgi:hypothetical protein